MLRAVEKKEHARDYSGRRSPDRQTRKHWHNPTPTVKPGKEPNRWQFRTFGVDTARRTYHLHVLF